MKLRYAIRCKNGRLWRMHGKVETFRSPREAQVWLVERAERIVVYRPRKKVKRWVS